MTFPRASDGVFQCGVNLALLIHWLLLEIFSLEIGQISSDLKKSICIMTACLSFHKHLILWHFCSGMGRNQNFKFFFALFFFLHFTGNFAANFRASFSLKCLSIFLHMIYLGLHLADHSDLGIFEKIFSSCRTWVQMMPKLVKGDDVRCGTRANACHSWFWPVQDSMGY